MSTLATPSFHSIWTHSGATIIRSLNPKSTTGGRRPGIENFRTIGNVAGLRLCRFSSLLRRRKDLWFSVTKGDPSSVSVANKTSGVSFLVWGVGSLFRFPGKERKPRLRNRSMKRGTSHWIGRWEGTEVNPREWFCRQLLSGAYSKSKPSIREPTVRE